MVAGCESRGVASSGRRGDARPTPGGRARPIVLQDDRPLVELDQDEEAGMRQGLAELAAGQAMPIARLRAKLKRQR
jgi:hypothetical protein